jgi:hypothetical protein
MNDSQVRKYLESCASECPSCSDTRYLRRIADDYRGRPAFVLERDQQPKLRVSCYCAFCAAEWVETYKLDSVSDLREVRL